MKIAFQRLFILCLIFWSIVASAESSVNCTELGTTRDELNHTLYSSVKANNVEKTKASISCGADVNYSNGFTILQWSIGRPDVFQYLLSVPGLVVDAPDMSGNTALLWTLFYAQYDISYTTLLLNARASVMAINHSGTTALIYASDSHDLNRVKLVISSLPGWVLGDSNVYSNYINYRDLNGKTALDFAIAGNEPSIVEYLKSIGAK